MDEVKKGVKGRGGKKRENMEGGEMHDKKGDETQGIMLDVRRIKVWGGSGVISRLRSQTDKQKDRQRQGETDSDKGHTGRQKG